MANQRPSLWAAFREWPLLVRLLLPSLLVSLGGGLKVGATAITQVTTAPFLLALGFVPALPVAVAALWGQAGLMRAGDPLYSAFTMERAKPQQRGTVSSLRNMVWTFGRAAGQSLSGLVQVRWGFQPLFAASTALYLASAGLLLASFGRKDRNDRKENSP